MNEGNKNSDFGQNLYFKQWSYTGGQTVSAGWQVSTGGQPLLSGMAGPGHGISMGPQGQEPGQTIPFVSLTCVTQCPGPIHPWASGWPGHIKSSGPHSMGGAGGQSWAWAKIGSKAKRMMNFMVSIQTQKSKWCLRSSLRAFCRGCSRSFWRTSVWTRSFFAMFYDYHSSKLYVAKMSHIKASNKI